MHERVNSRAASDLQGEIGLLWRAASAGILANSSWTRSLYAGTLYYRYITGYKLSHI